MPFRCGLCGDRSTADRREGERQRARHRIGFMRRRIVTACIVALAAAVCAATLTAQRRGRGFGTYIRSPTPQSFDGAFNFCRVAFPYSNMGDGGGWLVDYPRADINLSIRLAELTKTRISLDASG